MTFKGGSVLGLTFLPWVFFFLFGVAYEVLKSYDLVILGAYCNFFILVGDLIDLGVLGQF